MFFTFAQALTSPARGEFVEGNIYVTVITGEPSCFGAGDLSAIVEINPETGELRIFADSNGSDMCIPNGLRFTPDGERLLQLENWESKVLSFHPDGTSETLLDASDGLVGPGGANGIVFDAGGDLYVLNAGTSWVLRFPADGSPATVFAGGEDGISGRGALDFALNADLFYAGDFADGVLRITPEGEGFFFDDPPQNQQSLTFDKHDNLYVGSSFSVYRYVDTDPATRTVLASGFLSEVGLPLPVDVCADGRSRGYQPWRLGTGARSGVSVHPHNSPEGWQHSGVERGW